MCEIDAGFESDNYFLLLEAKNFSVENFIVRQLYYPYRLWKSKLNKQVIPMLFTYSNDVFSFFIYEFSDLKNYSSLKLVQQRNYIIEPEEIDLNDIGRVFETVREIYEPDVPFPQADTFERFIDLLGLLFERDLSRDEITDNYSFTSRQTNYYTDIGRYLGLVEKYKNSDTREIYFTLSDEGKKILAKRPKEKYLSIVAKILEHRVFYLVMKRTLMEGDIPEISSVVEIMNTCPLRNIHGNTIERRARTVRSMIKWIISLT